MYDAKLVVEFGSEKEADDTQKIFNDSKKLLESSTEELFFHDYLYENNLDRGIQFDSMWFPQEIERHLEILYITMAGSLSGTREQDIETWLKLLGAKLIYKEYAMFGDPCLSVSDIIGKGVKELKENQDLETKLNRHIVTKFETEDETKICHEKILPIYEKHKEDHETFYSAANILKVLNSLDKNNINQNLLSDTWNMGYPWINGNVIMVELVTTDADAAIEGFVNWFKEQNAIEVNLFEGPLPPD